jgi:hypothetical protein
VARVIAIGKEFGSIIYRKMFSDIRKNFLQSGKPATASSGASDITMRKNPGTGMQSTP